jgi:hypothetical protein
VAAAAAEAYQPPTPTPPPVDVTDDAVVALGLEPANLKRPAPADRLTTSDGETSPLPHYLQVELRAGARDMLRHDLGGTAAAVEPEAAAPPAAAGSPRRFSAEAAAAVAALQAEEAAAEAAVEAEAEEWRTGRGVSLERTATSRVRDSWGIGRYDAGVSFPARKFTRNLPLAVIYRPILRRVDCDYRAESPFSAQRQMPRTTSDGSQSQASIRSMLGANAAPFYLVC